MINIKTPREIELMRVAGEIVGDTHKYLIPYLKPGITTKEIDSLARDYITGRDAIPSCYNYNGYPGNICISNPSGLLLEFIFSSFIIAKGIILPWLANTG